MSQHRHQSRGWVSAVASLAMLLTPGCEAGGPVQTQLLESAPEDNSESSTGLTGTVPLGSTLETTAGVNFRKGPSTSYAVIRVLPSGTSVVTVDETKASNGFFKVVQQGTVGWVYGSYLKLVSAGNGGSGGSAGNANTGKAGSGGNSNSNGKGGSSNSEGGSGGEAEGKGGSSGSGGQSAGNDRAAAIARAEQVVGFSYWWGHARWLPEGSDSSTAGQCTGNCPNCTHSGSYGADCSGMAAKVWQVPSTNDDVSQDQHPYGTATFNAPNTQWSEVPRGSLLPADALVYDNSGSGHIVIYDSGDVWGEQWVYECRGCAAGCVHNLRKISTTYKPIRRTGY